MAVSRRHAGEAVELAPLSPETPCSPFSSEVKTHVWEIAISPVSPPVLFLYFTLSRAGFDILYLTPQRPRGAAVWDILPVSGLSLYLSSYSSGQPEL